MLAGSQCAFIEDAETWKHRFGGAMRQAGIVAAAGLYAFENHVERLAEDHANARRLAARLKELPGIELETPDPETNLVFFNGTGTGQTAGTIGEALLRHGIRMQVQGETRIRAVTHLDISCCRCRKGGRRVGAGDYRRLSASGEYLSWPAGLLYRRPKGGMR